jgi:hypothetical protein
MARICLAFDTAIPSAEEYYSDNLRRMKKFSTKGFGGDRDFEKQMDNNIIGNAEIAIGDVMANDLGLAFMYHF